jgi:tetratricopeptide (TPR) repeat protein
MKSILLCGRTLLFVLLTLAVLSTKAFSQNLNINDLLKDGKEITYKALITYDKELLVKAKSIFELIIKTDSSNAAARYNLTYTEYKLIEMGLQIKGDSLFDENYKSALDNADKLISMKKYLSEANSVLAAIYMMKIANSSMSAVTLIPKMYKLLDEAEAINPLNPTSYIVRGEMKYNTPGAFGGSFEQAAKSFNKAVLIFEQSPDSEVVNVKWGYLEALAWLGRSLEKMNNFDAARFTFQKAITVEPNYGWVKYVLMPELERTANNK